MPTIAHPTFSLSRTAKDRTLDCLGLPKILGSILLFALAIHSVPAFSATLPPATQSVNLAWNPSPDINVVGYYIYCGTASGIYTNKINAGNVTNITISGLAAGVTYYFVATAYDALGDESVFSSEISYLVPANLPAVQIHSGFAGQFVLTVSGPPGQTYDVQASPDLSAWTVIGTVTPGASGSLDFTDTNAANFPQRYYRTQQIP